MFVKMVEVRILVPFLILFGLSAVLTQSSTTNTCENMSNTTCEDCLKNVSCLWCQTTQKCVTYPVRTILPPYSLCPLSEARWGSCWVNFQTLIITLSVVCAAIIIAIFICCFCCCKCENIGTQRTEAKMDKQATKRKAKQEERKSEMKMKHDEIRKKYGLTKESPYSRFENS